MNFADLAKRAGALVAFAICTGCSSGAPSAGAMNYQYMGKTLFVNGRPVTAQRLSPTPRSATIVPDRLALGKRIEYIFNDYGTYASIFDYPKSTQQIGSIPGDGGQGCTNRLNGYGKEIFWDVAGATEIFEYAVPKKLIKTLSDSLGAPSSCAMNEAGDLAVGILYGSNGGDVVIYQNATGSGTVYTTPLVQEFFDGYDNSGNLFADGFNGSGFFELVELPAGESKFKVIATSNTVQFPGSVQWDGTYLTVVDQSVNEIYRYTISGKTATLEGTVSLGGAGDCAQTWIVKGLVYCADAGTTDDAVFQYPAGGEATAILTGEFDLPLGVVAARL